MHRIPAGRSTLHLALATLLLLVVQAGQWIGLEHRVRHAGLEAVSLHLLAGVGGDAGAEDNEHGNTHSCTLFDAAALGAGIPAAYLPGDCGLAVQDWVRAWPALTWQAAFRAHFSSRAPPAG